MPLSDGDPAEDGDIWFRIATHRDHLVRGRVHHSAFGGSAIASPKKAKNRPWDRELSGRIRSLAGTLDEITRHAEAYCQRRAKTFSGVMYVRVRDARKEFENILNTAVHYTPLEEDSAHADLTFKGWIDNTKESRERFNLWFSDMLHALHHPGQLEHLPKAEEGSYVVSKILQSLLRLVAPTTDNKS
jgi:hypothetical protein